MNDQELDAVVQQTRTTLRGELADWFTTMPPDQVEMVAERMSEFMWGRIPTPALRKIKRGAPTRILEEGADVNTDDDGNQLGHAGPTLPDIWNFLSTDITLEPGDGRQVNIRPRGGGADCMFDYLVSTCWATEVAAGRGTEGQTFTSLTGCTFEVFSTIQGACTDAAALGDNDGVVIYICPGVYNENVTITSQVHLWGSGGMVSNFTDAARQIASTGSRPVPGPVVSGVAGGSTLNFASGTGVQSTVHGLTINTRSGFYGIEVGTSVGVDVTDCYFYGTGTGIQCEDYVNYIAGNMFVCTTGIACANNSNDPLITSNRFMGCTTGITLGEDTQVIGNKFNSCTTAVSHNNSLRGAVQSNYFTACTRFMDGTTNAFQGPLTISDNHGDATANFIRFGDFGNVADGVFIFNNTCRLAANATAMVLDSVHTIVCHGNTMMTTSGGLTAFKSGGTHPNNFFYDNHAELISAGNWRTFAPVEVARGEKFKGTPFYFTDDVPLAIGWVAFDIDWAGTEVAYAANAGTGLTASATNYIFADSSAVTINTTGFPTTQHKKLMSVTCGVQGGNATYSSHVFYGDIWYIATPAGIGAAPVDATFVTLSTNGTLTNERVLTAANGVDVIDGGAGSTVTLRVNTVMDDDGDTKIQTEESADEDIIRFDTGGTQRMVIDSTGNVVIGGDETQDTLTLTGAASAVAKAAVRWEDATHQLGLLLSQHALTQYPLVSFVKSRGTMGTPTVVGNGDGLGRIEAYGFDGSEYSNAATIKFETDGGIGAGDMPGRIVFLTSADGSAAPTERMRLTKDGALRLTNLASAPATPASSTANLYVLTADELLRFMGDNGAAYLLAHEHIVSAYFDWSAASTSTPQALAGPMPRAGTITGVTSKAGENVTIGATAWIGDIHLIAAANINTDGQGTVSLFTTKPTVTNGNMAQSYGVPDLTTTFAAGDYLAFYTDQAGTNATYGQMAVTVRYT